jgi:hypothetical protein
MRHYIEDASSEAREGGYSPLVIVAQVAMRLLSASSIEGTLSPR